MVGRFLSSPADIAVVGVSVGLAGVYLRLNVCSRSLYLLGNSAIANARPGSFADAFFFSVETISTIGYGQMSPATLYGNIVMTVEAMFGLILTCGLRGRGARTVHTADGAGNVQQGRRRNAL